MASKKKTPAAELAEKLLAVLEAQRGLGKEAYPLTLQRLAELTDPQAPQELVVKAVGAKPFKERVVLENKAKPAALVALVEDTGLLAGDPRLLAPALERLCTPEKPLWLLSKVKAKIENTKLRKPFEDAIGRQIAENTLPPTVGFRLEKNKPLLYLHSIPPPPLPPEKPEDVLAETLVRVLEAQRQLGRDSYPLSLKRLVELADPQAARDLVVKAIGKKPFKDRVVVANKTNAETPLAFIEDLVQLAASPMLLEFALGKACSSASPTCPPSKLSGQVDTKLKKPLQDAVARQIREKTLPTTVGHLLLQDKSFLFLQSNPPQPPADQKLAESLLGVLEAQRQLGPSAYPPLLSRLIELTDPAAKAALVKKALAHPALQGKITLLGLVDAKKPVVFVGEQAQLLSSGWLLEFLLGAKRQPNENAFMVETLLPKKSPLLAPLLETVNRQIDANTLPSSIGWMWIGGKKQLFLLVDVHHSGPAATPVAPPVSPTPTPMPSSPPREAPADFARAFDEAFDQLNQRNGGHNFVSLVELRQALPLARRPIRRRAAQAARRRPLHAQRRRGPTRPQPRGSGSRHHGGWIALALCFPESRHDRPHGDADHDHPATDARPWSGFSSTSASATRS